jgi:membrane protein implicated in regulation of membrane protease activity
MSQNNNKYVIKPVIGVLSKYRMFIVVTIAYAIAFIIVYFGIPHLMYLWWGYNVGSNTAIGYYMEFAVPLMMMTPLLLITFGLIWHVATELTDPVMNAVRQRAIQKLIDDNRYRDKIEVIAENYLNKHLERYGFIKVVKPGLRGRVEVLFKRGQHGESVVM